MDSNFIKLPELAAMLDIENHNIDGAKISECHLKDIAKYYIDQQACNEMLKKENPLMYKVCYVDSKNGDGDLHYGMGTIMPGQIGNEYHMTKGHFHQWREAAELYIGLSGEGMMLLEEENTGKSQLVPLCKNNVVYVPGGHAHRTFNVGPEPLTYLGIYPAKAGHDYGKIAIENFKKVLVNASGKPQLIDRSSIG